MENQQRIAERAYYLAQEDSTRTDEENHVPNHIYWKMLPETFHQGGAERWGGQVFPADSLTNTITRFFAENSDVSGITAEKISRGPDQGGFRLWGHTEIDSEKIITIESLANPKITYAINFIKPHILFLRMY